MAGIVKVVVVDGGFVEVIYVSFAGVKRRSTSISTNQFNEGKT